MRRSSPADAALVTRSHPLPAILAEALVEGALDPVGQDKLGRVGAWPTSSVAEMTTVALLRLRFKLTVHGRRERILLVEEANALAFGPSGVATVSGEEARGLLNPRRFAISPRSQKNACSTRTLSACRPFTLAQLPIYAHARRSSGGRPCARSGDGCVPRVSVEAVLPADVVGLFVLIPSGA